MRQIGIAILLVIAIALILMIAGCTDSEPFSKEGREPSNTKEGTISDLDFVGSGSALQLKFTDGDLWLCYNMDAASKKDIRIGQTGVLSFYDKIHGDSCYCGSTMAYWEVTKERSDNDKVTME